MLPIWTTVDPNVAYVMLIIALWATVTAAYAPGTGLLEGLSALSWLLTLWMLSALPTNWLAVMVVVFGGLGFMLMPFINRRMAVLSIVGLGLQSAGSLALLNNGRSVSLALIIALAGLALAYHQLLLVPMLNRYHRQTEGSAEDRILGSKGRVISPINPMGSVRAMGEIWTARSDKPLDSGDEVVVIEREGLVLLVEGIKHKREEI